MRKWAKTLVTFLVTLFVIFDNSELLQLFSALERLERGEM